MKWKLFPLVEAPQRGHEGHAGLLGGYHGALILHHQMSQTSPVNWGPCLHVYEGHEGLHHYDETL